VPAWSSEGMEAMTKPEAPAEPPDYVEVARVLLRLVEEIRSDDEGTMTAPRSVRYRLEGAVVALMAVASGDQLNLEDLFVGLGLT